MTPRRSSVGHPPCTTGPIMTAVRNRSAQQYTTIYTVFRWLLELGTVTSKKVAICRRPTNLHWYANSVVEVCHTAHSSSLTAKLPHTTLLRRSARTQLKREQLLGIHVSPWSLKLVKTVRVPPYTRRFSKKPNLYAMSKWSVLLLGGYWAALDDSLRAIKKVISPSY